MAEDLIWGLVHTNGWQRSCQPLPRRTAWQVMIEKKTSTRFNHEPDVGDVSHASTSGWLWIR